MFMQFLPGLDHKNNYHAMLNRVMFHVLLLSESTCGIVYLCPCSLLHGLSHMVTKMPAPHLLSILDVSYLHKIFQLFTAPKHALDKIQ